MSQRKLLPAQINPGSAPDGMYALLVASGVVSGLSVVGAGSFDYQGTWLPGVAYTTGQYVSKNGKLYKAVAGSTSIDPETPPTTTIYSAAVLADAPIVYWRFGESSGTSALDSSGNSRTATYVNPSLGATGLQVGDSDKANDFNGTSARVTYGTPSFLNLTSLAFDLLVNLDTLGGVLINRDDSGSLGTAARQFNLSVDGGGVVTAASFFIGGAYYSVASGPTTIVTGVTYHIGVRIEGGFLTVYINGVAGTPVAISALVGSSSQPLWIGANWYNAGSGSSFTDGRIDEVAFYSTLSATRMAAHSTARTATSTTFWQLVAGGGGKTLIGKFDGTLVAGAGVTRFYNDTGNSLKILSVRITAETPPVGASVIADVNQNGTSVFTVSGHRPTVVSGGTTGITTSIDLPTWASGNYLTVDLDQVGSTGTEGANLTIQIEVAP